MKHEALTHAIIGAAMRVHNELGPGYAESIYRNALCWELRLRRMDVRPECPLLVRYRDLVVGNYRADIIVADVVLVEVKAVSVTVPMHEAQVLSYLKATGLEVGLLVNFGGERLEFVRRVR